MLDNAMEVISGRKVGKICAELNGGQPLSQEQPSQAQGL
jgi:hypothetical protein